MTTMRIMISTPTTHTTMMTITCGTIGGIPRNHAVIIHELAKQTLQPILDDTEMVTEDISDKDEHSDREVYKDIKLMEA